MARTAKRYKKNTEKKVLGIPVCMAAIYARLSVDSDEKKSESIETQVTLIKEFIQKHNENLVQKFLNKWTIFLFCSILFSSNQKEH